MAAGTAHLEAHLATCASCRELALAHTQAQALRGAVPVAVRAPVTAVAQRGALVLGLVGVVATGLLLAAQPRPRAVEPEPLAGVAQHAPDPEREEAEAWAALVGLHDSLLRPRDVLIADATYASFGSLPEWVAPTALHPLAGLGKAVSPLVYPQED